MCAVSNWRIDWLVYNSTVITRVLQSSKLCIVALASGYSVVVVRIITRRPASTDRTARRQFQATGQPVSRTQASDAMSSRLPRYEAKCVQRRCFQCGSVPLRSDIKGTELTPCQYIDTTRKAIDCATTLPLRGFIQWNFAADLSSFIVEIVQKTTNLGVYPHFEEVSGGVEPWLMARWKARVEFTEFTDASMPSQTILAWVSTGFRRITPTIATDTL